MLTIEIDNSFCKVTGASLEASALITETLTYENSEVHMQLQQLRQLAFISQRYGNFSQLAKIEYKMRQLEKEKTICWFRDYTFPTGHLQIIKWALEEAKMPFELKDLRIQPKKSITYKWRGAITTARPYQEEAIKLAVDSHRGVLELAVGSGKTFLAQKIVQSIGCKTIIIEPSKDLAVQTYDSFVEVFGNKSVCLVDGNKMGVLRDIIIITIHQVTSLRKKGLLEGILEGIDAVIIDEVHHSGSSSFTELLPYFNGVYYKWGLSGTFLRNDSKTMDMWGFLSNVLFRYSAAEAIAQGYLTPLEAKVHNLPGVRSSNYQTEYAKNYGNNQYLFEKIEEIIDLETSPSAQILILINRKDTLGKLLFDFLSKTRKGIEYISGDSKQGEVKKALSNFNAKKVRILIGSTIIGEGIDIRSTDHLILARGGKSEIEITQALGRAVRLFEGKKKAFVHDFNFLGTKFMEKHLKKRLTIYKKQFNAKITGEEDGDEG